MPLRIHFQCFPNHCPVVSGFRLVLFLCFFALFLGFFACLYYIARETTTRPPDKPLPCSLSGRTAGLVIGASKQTGRPSRKTYRRRHQDQHHRGRPSHPSRLHPFPAWSATHAVYTSLGSSTAAGAYRSFLAR